MASSDRGVQFDHDSEPGVLKTSAPCGSSAARRTRPRRTDPGCRHPAFGHDVHGGHDHLAAKRRRPCDRGVDVVSRDVGAPHRRHPRRPEGPGSSARRRRLSAAVQREHPVDGFRTSWGGRECSQPAAARKSGLALESVARRSIQQKSPGSVRFISSSMSRVSTCTIRVPKPDASPVIGVDVARRGIITTWFVYDAYSARRRLGTHRRRRAVLVLPVRACPASSAGSGPRLGCTQASAQVIAAL